MEIHYTTIVGSKLSEESPLGWLTDEQFLKTILIIGDVYSKGTVIQGRLILAHKATPAMYNVTAPEGVPDSLIYKAHVHNIGSKLAPYGVIFKSKDVTIQARDYHQKVYDIYPYKSGWLLK